MQMQYKDGYAVVCDPQFNDASASIACREMRLGTSGKVIFDRSLARASSGKNFWHTVACRGTWVVQYYLLLVGLQAI